MRPSAFTDGNTPISTRLRAFLVRLQSVKSLMAHAYDHPGAGDRQRWFPAWGIARILRSPIRRSGQGGYGTFGPAEVVWQNVAPNDITVSTRAKENRALP